MGPVVCWSCCLVDAVRVEDVDGAPAGRLRVAAAQASAGETSTGSDRSVVVPSPSWPWSLCPKRIATALVSTAQSDRRGRGSA